MDIDDIRAWLAKPTSVTSVAAGTTRGQLLASLIYVSMASVGINPWQAGREWHDELAADLAELDPRILEPRDDPQMRTSHDLSERILSAVQVILSATLCGGLSVPTR